MLADLVRKNRSYRRFYQDRAISEETLRELVDLARLTPSGRNLQPLRYMLSWQPELNAQIFPTLAWAGYLTDWQGPEPGEQPAGYIIILGDKDGVWLNDYVVKSKIDVVKTPNAVVHGISDVLLPTL